MVGFGEEFEWRRRGWSTRRAIVEREGASGRESADMSEKKEKGKKEGDGLRWASPKRRHAVTITATPSREHNVLSSPEAGSMSHAPSSRWSAVV